MKKVKLIYNKLINKVNTINLSKLPYNYITFFLFAIVMILISFIFKGCKELHNINKTNSELDYINNVLLNDNKTLKEEIKNNDILKISYNNKIDSLLNEINNRDSILKVNKKNYILLYNNNINKIQIKRLKLKADSLELELKKLK